MTPSKFVIPEDNVSQTADRRLSRAELGPNPYLEGFSRKKNPEEAEGEGKFCFLIQF